MLVFFLSRFKLFMRFTMSYVYYLIKCLHFYNWFWALIQLICVWKQFYDTYIGLFSASYFTKYLVFFMKSFFKRLHIGYVLFFPILVREWQWRSLLNCRNTDNESKYVSTFSRRNLEAHTPSRVVRWQSSKKATLCHITYKQMTLLQESISKFPLNNVSF